jgi:hypothetical protein
MANLPDDLARQLADGLITRREAHRIVKRRRQALTAPGRKAPPHSLEQTDPGLYRKITGKEPRR